MFHVSKWFVSSGFHIVVPKWVSKWVSQVGFPSGFSQVGPKWVSSGNFQVGFPSGSQVGLKWDSKWDSKWEGSPSGSQVGPSGWFLSTDVVYTTVCKNNTVVSC